MTFTGESVSCVLFVYAASATLGAIAKRLRQPSLLGELLAGVFLSLWLGSDKGILSLGLLSTLAFYASLAYLFVAGFEIRLSSVLREVRSGLAVSAAAMALPFAIGYGVALLFPEFFGLREGVPPTAFAIYLGIALSISALPVIARTLQDLGLYQSRVGTITMSAVIIDDLLGWIAFSGLVTLAATSVHIDGVRMHLPLIGYLLGVAAGALLRDRSSAKLTESLETGSRLISPLFFGAIGLKIGNPESFDIGLIAALLVLACIGKILGGFAAARWSGNSSSESWAIGLAMNSRGAMCIIMAEMGKTLGLIQDRLMTALVATALMTSMMTGPAILRVLGRKKITDDRPEVLDSEAGLPEGA